MKQTVQDLYTVLGVPRDAEGEAIKKAYRKLSKEHHPDTGGEAEDFHRIQLAYEVLSDPERRKRYDETGATAAPQDAMANAVKSAVELVVGLCVEVGEFEIDVIATARKRVTDGQALLRQNKNDCIRKAKQLRKRHSKLVFKGKGVGIIGAAMLNQAAMFDDNAVKCEEEIANLSLVLDVLKEYEYQMGGEGGGMFDITPQMRKVFYGL